MLVRKPSRCYEIRHEDITDLIAVLVAFDRVAHLSCPEDAFGILIGAVEPWIHSHLAELVGRTDAHACMICVECFDENFGDRETFIRQIVIGERVSLVTIVEEYEPPATGGWHPVLGYESKVRVVDAPDRRQILVPLLL